jgi:phosphoribosylglycinamide formyltransferase-1
MTTSRIAFLSSGGGGNLRLIHALATSGSLSEALVGAVIADRECAALEWARANAIPAHQVTYRRDDPDAMHDLLAEVDADVIVTNVHKILDEALVERFAGRLLNLHYSLLPSFAGTIGMTPVRAARELGCRLIGATAHLVTAAVDAGPIVAQASVADSPERPLEDLCDDVFRCGGVALAAAIDTILHPGVRPGGTVDAGDARIFAGPLPAPAIVDQLSSDDFWLALR